MMNEIFYACVELLKKWAAYFGTTYEKINVVIFCIIEPIVFLIMAIWIVFLWLKVRKLKRQLQ